MDKCPDKVEGFPMPDEKVADCDQNKTIIPKCSHVPPLESDMGAVTQLHEQIRKFDSGATRNNDPDRLDFEGFICPLVIEAYAKYLHKNRLQADGQMRDSDNWQKGIDKTVYMKSKWRHFWKTWKLHRYPETKAEIVESLCAEMFNTMGYLHELLKE